MNSKHLSLFFLFCAFVMATISTIMLFLEPISLGHVFASLTYACLAAFMLVGISEGKKE